MKNIIKRSFGNYYYEKFGKPVRKKQDIVLVVLDVMNILLIGETQNASKGTLWIKRDKMSRLFCFLEDKYFSVVFPFETEYDMEHDQIVRIYDTAQDMEIDSRLLVLLRRMLEKIDFEKNSVEKIFEDAYLDVAEDGYTDTEISKCFGLILNLLSTELGYIRYDHDPKHENGVLHPLHHLDVNFSVRGTYKFGLNKDVEIDEFVDMLDTKTACRYII